MSHSAEPSSPTRFRIKRKLVRMRAVAARWLQHHPRLQWVLEWTGCLRVDDRSIARGVAAGLFIALTPVFGMQTVLLVVACVVFRANFPVAFIVSCISNPFTIGPMLLIFNALGAAVFEPFVQNNVDGSGLGEEAIEETLVTALGSLLVAAPVAMIGFSLTLWLRANCRARMAGN